MLPAAPPLSSIDSSPHTHIQQTGVRSHVSQHSDGMPERDECTGSLVALSQRELVRSAASLEHVRQARCLSAPVFAKFETICNKCKRASAPSTFRFSMKSNIKKTAAALVAQIAPGVHLIRHSVGHLMLTTAARRSSKALAPAPEEAVKVRLASHSKPDGTQAEEAGRRDPGRRGQERRRGGRDRPRSAGAVLRKGRFVRSQLAGFGSETATVLKRQWVGRTKLADFGSEMATVLMGQWVEVPSAAWRLWKRQGSR